MAAVLDVWVEHEIEEVATSHRSGNRGSIEGPYHVPGPPDLGADGTMPMRDGEQGTALVWDATITSTDGTPLAGKVELWHADADGSCGKLIAAAGWHAWRPAHLHVKVTAPGHELLTAQLYFPGDPHNDDDIATAVKPELILNPVPQSDGSDAVRYDFVLDPARS